jgi:hypothetical protein
VSEEKLSNTVNPTQIGLDSLKEDFKTSKKFTNPTKNVCVFSKISANKHGMKVRPW